ncbi:hypothetical protein [Candidatus Chloroploca asiatica]|uniref:HepT-like domain-containing protein n=1 Tax=Candidatus Chloroploca asiatica TaxID=1506545 RepID=A0A2H3KRW4_9CHLR|nr:hypothetical protein [Candidatus Chloroploca asiatica]PDV97965.1 hypothetical protein A9Q02_16630 [Candidatus Chloroploca asiatica]
MSAYTALAGRMQASLHDLEQVVNRAEALLGKAQQQNDVDYLDGVALNLHGFYAGVERIFEDIARTLDESVPTGSDWHRDLLLQMSAAIDGVRPAAISQTTRFSLDEYRGFRHVVRNVYTFNLRPLRLQELTQNLRPCYQQLSTELASFTAFLRDLDNTAP